MAKTTAPLLSFDASGQIGETLVFSSWKGRKYTRRYVKPANPRTAAQTTARNSFQFLQRIFPYMPAGATDSWLQFAENSQFTARNGFTKVNQPLIRLDSDLQNFLCTVAASGGLSSAGTSFTAASGAIDVTIAAPTLPSGWTINTSWAVAVQNIDPQSDSIPDIGAASDATDPYEPDVTGLNPSTEYRVGAWFVFNKPDGSLAYGPGDHALVTTLA